MTAIVAHVGRGYAVVGADRAISGDNTIATYGVPKIVKRGNVILGLAGIAAKGLLLFQRWGVCAADEQALNLHLQELTAKLGGTNPAEFWDDSSLLVVVPGRIYQADHSGCLLPFRDKWLAIGNGSEPAQAAAMTAVHFGEEPGPAIRRGLRTAAGMCHGVRGPFDLVTLGL